MKCPYCNDHDLKVIDSRDTLEGKAIRRRRECQTCHKRFTTFETIELTIQVKKRDGRYEDFDQQKLTAGMQAACTHTKVSREQIIAISAKISDEMMRQQVREIAAQEVGDLVVKELKKIDPVAYIRFACVYSRIQDMEELIEAIRSIKSHKPVVGIPTKDQSYTEETITVQEVTDGAKKN